MSIDADLFRAILAMDSYNRGYDAGVNLGEGSDDSGVSIGIAQIDRTSTVLGPEVDSDAGFYAIAYNWNGETVISYRGTDVAGVLACRQQPT